ncbi:MAG: helix-hairpin-helix domain-containing protein [bacterium]|nr:helix-hairpin-helix domain-containing protein [bacterium]
MPGNFVNNYFGFNKQQRSGLLVLCGISFVLLVIRITYPFFIEPDAIILKDLAVYETKLASLETNSNAAVFHKGEPSTTSAPRTLFTFDPNHVSREQLLQLGFKEKTAGIFIKFRSKGFIFKEKEDLKKVYGISEQFYAQLEPYVLIEKVTSSEPIKPAASKTPTALKQSVAEKIELNAADSSSLLSLSGVGNGTAKRILKYRSMLGGYADVAQLKEVYGLSEELYQKLKDQVCVNTVLIKKIDLNKDDFKVINNHPYISYELTKLIFDWRRKTILTANNFMGITNDSTLYAKLLPYLDFH